MRTLTFVLITFLSLTFVRVAQGAILFEGYSKVLSGGVHVGYIISRMEFDDSKKQFKSSYFMKTNELGGNVTESLVATSTDGFVPLSYQYTSITGSEAKTIDATFKNNRIMAEIKKGKKVEKINKPIQPGVFLSTFLGYMMLKNPKGISVGNAFSYKAIAEEDGTIEDGSAMVEAREDALGLKAYRLKNTFKGTKFISWISDKAEPLLVKSPTVGISTELVEKPQLATNGMSMNAKTLEAIFGNVPLGLENEVSKKALKDVNSKIDNAPVPGGEVLKAAPMKGTKNSGGQGAHQ